MALYQVGLLGDVDETLHRRFETTLFEVIEPMGLAGQVVVSADPGFDPPNDYSSAAVFFGSKGFAADEVHLRRLMRSWTPILPVVSDLKTFKKEVPEALRAINGLERDANDPTLERIVSAVLELLRLIPRQRRVFLSYKRSESREVAVQLLEHLTSLQFDVFLDTHGVPPGENFQDVLWHRLSDSDVLVTLDTPTYFESRWTRHEYGRALAKSLVPLRLGWPGVAPPRRSLNSESVQLDPTDFEGGLLTAAALGKAALAVERARSRGIAVRTAELNGAVVKAVEKIDGRFLGYGLQRAVVIALHNGHQILVYPALGVPSAEHLHAVSTASGSVDSRAVLYSELGIEPKWQEHLKWLGSEVKSARLLANARAAYDLATWVEDA